MDYNCGGWATKYNTLCADGLTIMPGAFAQNDGVQVPLVWNHGHDSVSNVLGHCVLADKPEGVYAYCVFNETEQGQNANALVHGGDIEALSIWANQLTKTTDGRKVAKGNIREVSLVLGGCNPGAGIDHIMHSDTSGADNDCLIYNNEYYNFKLDGAMDDTIDHSMKADDKEGGKIKMPETTTEKDKKEPEKPDKLPAPTSESSTGKNLVNLESPAIIKMVLSTTERIPNLPFSIWEPALLGSATIAVPPSSSYNVGATGSSSLQEEKNITTATIGRINFLNAFIFKSFNS